MNFKTTIVLLVLVAGLAAYVIHESMSTPNVVHPGSGHPQILPRFSPDDATRIAVARGAGLKD
jgi:hypothetical protein